MRCSVSKSRNIEAPPYPSPPSGRVDRGVSRGPGGATPPKSPTRPRSARPPPPQTGRDRGFAAPQVAGGIGRWVAHLGAERRMSAKTLDAYGRDVRQFLAFLARHFGARVTLARLCDLAPHDVR